jgi:hypothetical protein
MPCPVQNSTAIPKHAPLSVGMPAPLGKAQRAAPPFSTASQGRKNWHDSNWAVELNNHLLDHLFCHLPYGDAKVPSRAKMFSLISLPQMRKLFKQLARRAPFDPPHDLGWHYCPRTTGQNVNVILAHHAFHYPDLKGFTGLTCQISNSLRHVPRHYFIPVLRYFVTHTKWYLI